MVVPMAEVAPDDWRRELVDSAEVGLDGDVADGPHPLSLAVDVLGGAGPPEGPFGAEFGFVRVGRTVRDEGRGE